MSLPAPALPGDDGRDELARRRAAASIAWTDPANWGPEPVGEWLGKGLPPWGRSPRCVAVRRGHHCRKAAIPGGTVCQTHGGAAPQVKKRAQLRLLSLVEPALALLAREMVQADKSSDRQRAANSLLDRAGISRTGADVSVDVARALILERHAKLRQQELERQRALGEDLADDEFFDVEMDAEAEWQPPIRMEKPPVDLELDDLAMLSDMPIADPDAAPSDADAATAPDARDGEA